jgi:hypothetical protein
MIPLEKYYMFLLDSHSFISPRKRETFGTNPSKHGTHKTIWKTSMMSGSDTGLTIPALF